MTALEIFNKFRGLWYAFDYNEVDDHTILLPNEHQVAGVFRDNLPHQDGAALAQLFTAAPEFMLAALAYKESREMPEVGPSEQLPLMKHWIPIMKHYFPERFDLWPDSSPAFAAAFYVSFPDLMRDLALAKAKGEPKP
jgi:hypothetical protein